MDFMMINSLRNYTQKLSLENKWQKKKATSDFTPDPSMNETERKNAQFKHTYKLQQENMENDEALTSILNKINSGAELSDAEMNYLKIASPQTYQSVKRAEMEEKQYERELENCKTKEDVEKLKTNKINAAVSKLNAIKDNPNIPEGVKVAIAKEAQASIDRIEKSTAEFAESGKLAKLPTEAEKTKAETEIREAERNETEENLTPDNTAETKPVESVADSRESADTVKEETSEETEKEMTRFEAEHTPEAEKLRRSKAKAAYMKAVSDNPEENTEK